MTKDRINVTKSFLPPKAEFQKYIDGIWINNSLTNNGPLSKSLEMAISDKYSLERSRLKVVNNGTSALQLSIRALGITGGEIITTPFSYVATVSSILWEQCTPVFVDIDPESFNLNPLLIEEKITDKTKGIMPVHVFGNPCDVESIKEIATKHGLSVIYDAAHAFGVEYNGTSIFEYGDISTCSFHATKLFHTIEGGLIYSSSNTIANKIELLKRFGHNSDEHISLGINAKMNELSAAMGLTNMQYIDRIIEDRKRAHDFYDKQLNGIYQKQSINRNAKYNYSYYPILLKDESLLIKVKNKLEEKNIFPRRYFYPSLNTLPYINNVQKCPVSEDISRRILCLPMYYDIKEGDMSRICEILKG